jgi:hypothetical protein
MNRLSRSNDQQLSLRRSSGIAPKRGIIKQRMSIELTREQVERLKQGGGSPASVHDPRSNAQYVLLPREQYEQLLEVVEDDAEQRALRRAAARGLAARLADDLK